MSVNEYDNRMARGRNRGGKPSKQEIAARQEPVPVKIITSYVHAERRVIRIKCPRCAREIVPKVAYTWIDGNKERRFMRCCQPCGLRFELQRDELGNELARVISKKADAS